MDDHHTTDNYAPTLRTLTRIVVLIAVVGGAFTGGVYAGAAIPTVPPCADDSGAGPVPCVWDAQDMGDGYGRSFVITDDGIAHYFGDLICPAQTMANDHLTACEALPVTHHTD